MRNDSECKLQRQPQCRAFFRSDALCAAQPDRERAVDGFACARPPNKSVRIGLVLKPVHHSRLPDGDAIDGAKRDKTGDRPHTDDNSSGKVNALSCETARPIRRSSVSSTNASVQRQKKSSSGGEGLLSLDKARHSIRPAAPCNTGALSGDTTQGTKCFVRTGLGARGAAGGGRKLRCGRRQQRQQNTQLGAYLCAATATTNMCARACVCVSVYVPLSKSGPSERATD